MKENIETKDVQRTEYLDKNGLDMLWTKVKENTHNQVEVERNRAVAKENSIADKVNNLKFIPYDISVTDKYQTDKDLSVKNSNGATADFGPNNGIRLSNENFAFDVNDTDGVKFSADNEISYSKINSQGLEAKIGDTAYTRCSSYYYLEIKNREKKIELHPYSFLGENGDATIYMDPTKILIKNIVANTQAMLTPSQLLMKVDDSQIILNSNGINLPNGDNNHILTSNGSTIDITEYAKKSELPAAATKEELGVVKVGDGLNVADGVISVAPDYIIDMMSYGVEWDTTVADPTCTRIGNMSYHKSLPIQSQYKGCVVKNGAVNYYLDPNDWSKKADGTPSVLDGTDGDVMVHIPKFYGKSGSNGNKRWVRIATTKIDPSWVEIPEMFVSAYKVTVNEGSAAPKAASVVNTSSSYRGGNNREGYDKYLSTDKFRTDLGKPRTNISRAAMRTNASNSGQELLCYEFYKWVFYWAYVIEYANFNSQKEFNSELTSDGYHQGGLGQGITTINSSHWNNYNNYYPLTPCGYTNEFGNFSGVKTIIIPAVETDNGITVGSDTTMYANRWRGFENPFGDIWTNLDGIVLKRDSANAESKVYTTTDSSKFGSGPSVMTVAGIEVAADGYTKEFDLGETGEIIPQLVGGSESTYKCDYHWCNTSSTDTRTLLVGGRANSGGGAGLGLFNSYHAVGLAYSTVGFRSVVRA